MSGSDARQFKDQTPGMSGQENELFSSLNALLPHSPLHLPSTKRASVALILRQHKSTSPFACPTTALSCLDLLFIQRAARPTDPWSAHIAFPGGHREPMDASDHLAAIRETREEVGLDLSKPDSYRLLGRLSDRPIRRGGASSSGVLCAFVFLQLPSVKSELSPQPTEVATAFWAPLEILHGRAARREHMMAIHTGEGLAGGIREVLGLARLRMPAVDVLSHAKDVVRVDSVQAPEVLLWGMTLACVGDVVQAFGGRRVDWPIALPENKVLAGVISFVAEVLWWLWERVARRDVEKNEILLNGSR